MDGTIPTPDDDALELNKPVAATPYTLPEEAKRGWATLKAINWRFVAIPFFVVGFAILFFITVGPWLGTDIGKWTLTAICGIALAFLIWPKTLGHVCVSLYKATLKAINWITKKTTAIYVWIFKTIWKVVAAVERAIAYLAKRFWSWISQLTILDWCFIPLWLAVIAAWGTLYFWDAKFYAGLAEPGLEPSFMAAGVVFRSFVIFGGLAIIWVKQQGTSRNKGPWFWWTRAGKDKRWSYWIPVPHMKLSNLSKSNLFGSSARTLRTIWLMGLLACLVAAMGFVTDGNDFHYRRADAVTQTEAFSVASADATIRRAKEEITRITADRDRQIEGARRSMDLVLDDGNAKNDDVSQYEENIRRYNTDAEGLVEKQNAIIAAAESEKLSAQHTATAEAVGDPGVKAVFRQPARYMDGFDGVTMRDAFGLFWVILLELCGAVGAQSLVAIQMALAKRRMAQAYGKEGGLASSKAELRKLIAYYNEISKPKPAQAPPDEDDEVKDEDDGNKPADPQTGV